MICGLEEKIHLLMELHDSGQLSPSFKRSRQQFYFSRLLGLPGMFRVDRLEIRELRWLDRFKWRRL